MIYTMEIKRIKCPNCGAVLDVKNSKNEAVKIIKCPNPQCGVQMRVPFGNAPKAAPAAPAKKPAMPSPGETQYGPMAGPMASPQPRPAAQQPRPAAPKAKQPATAGETVYGPMNGPAAPAPQAGPRPPRMACLQFNGQNYPLHIGTNTIGRAANNSRATVQIRTTDMFMSRLHSMIIISPDGNQALLSNGENKNEIRVNDRLLLPGDQIVLQHGDRIKMGDTIVNFIFS